MITNALKKYNRFSTDDANTKDQMKWYYTKDQKQQGPVTKDDLLRMLSDGTIDITELAWNKELDEWKTIQEIDILFKTYTKVEEPSTQASRDTTPVERRRDKGDYKIAEWAVRTSDSEPSSAPPTYLWQALLITLFCCQPLGLIGLFYANRAQSLEKYGRRRKALIASKKAKTCCNIGFLSGLIFGVLYFFYTAQTGSSRP
ncbi:CD225/dispanin family protein [Akkermansiaceae bacterium]|nr:CD225/dispanin family protein [Akkermansiaceae bacterium]